MADLTLTQLQTAAPANAIVDDVANNDVVISLKALMGEATVDLTDAKVGEAISKLLNAAATAQVTYNAANNTGDPDLRSYPRPTAGAPILDTTTGLYTSTFTYTVSVGIPLDLDEITALQTA